MGRRSEVILDQHLADIVEAIYGVDFAIRLPPEAIRITMQDLLAPEFRNQFLARIPEGDLKDLVIDIIYNELSDHPDFFPDDKIIDENPVEEDFFVEKCPDTGNVFDERRCMLKRLGALRIIDGKECGSNCKKLRCPIDKKCIAYGCQNPKSEEKVPEYYTASYKLSCDECRKTAKKFRDQHNPQFTK